MKEVKSLDIETPNNDEKLDEIENAITKHKIEIDKLVNGNCMTFDECKHYTELMLKCLYAVGDLSKPLMDKQDDIRTHYYTTYKSSPHLAKKLYLEHLNKIHNRYNILKNRCFRLLDDIEQLAYDKEYIH